MTDKPSPTDQELNTPSDAEIIMLDVESGVSVRAGNGAVMLTRADLEKCGQPAQAVEPVAWLRNTADPQPHAVTNLKYRSAVDAEAGVEYIPVFAAPQPVAVPLDEVRRLFDAGWKAAEPYNLTRLPDGSAFAIASFPLPDSHWLYAPREYAEGADEPKELPRPILNHTEHREAVVAAIRYAVRGATMCGKEPDFDPDALVQNAVYALCGPFGGRATLAEKIALAAAHQPVTREPLTDEQIDRAIAELGLNYLADAHATNRAVLRKLCRHAHGIKGGQRGTE